MSIRSDFGNYASGVGSTLEEIFSGAASTLSSIFNVSGTLIGNIFSGGFTGISEDGLDELKSGIEKLITELESHIKSFNGSQLERAIKGPMLQATNSYFDAVKEYLSKYVAGLKASIKDIEMAKANFSQGAQAAASDITKDIEDVRAAAQNIDLG